MKNTAVTKSSVWSKTGVLGLYRRDSGVFYSRYSLNGSNTFRSLDTDVLTIAKLKHSQRMADVEKSRQSGRTITSDCRTVGALARELEREVASLSADESTKANYAVWIGRLKDNWPGDFETTSIRSVTPSYIVALRDRLSGKGHTVANTRQVKSGYRPASVNQSLKVLRKMLDFAVRRHALAANPFDQPGVIRTSLYLPADTRRPIIPSNADMDRIFAEMERIPNEETTPPERLGLLTKYAAEAAEHARFLAYSGLRLQEANAATLADDHGMTFAVRGTKTATSFRTIPVVPAFRTLLDALKTRKIGGRFLDAVTSRRPLMLACKRLGLPVLRHHDLRHYFATGCIESGVDIPTVADWLGHADGGALLLKTYRHLRDKHSLAMAKTVNFSPSAGPTAQSSVA